MLKSRLSPRLTRQPSRPAQTTPILDASRPPGREVDCHSDNQPPHMPDPSYVTGQSMGALVAKGDVELLQFLIGFCESCQKT